MSGGELDMAQNITLVVACMLFLRYSVVLPHLPHVLLLPSPQPRCLRVQRRPIVRLSQQRLQREQDRLHAVHRRPLVLQDVQANRSIAHIYVGVVARRLKFDRRCHVWVV
jgi:hypothetical protein